MKALLAGMGAAEALAHPVFLSGALRGASGFLSGALRGASGEAEVLASFPKALYVATPAGIAALVAPGVGAGPLHVLLDAPPTPEAAQIGLDGAPLWQGALPDPGALAAAIPLVLEVLAPVARTNLVPPGRAAAAVLALGRGDLLEVAARLGGAGPGLTPAGDDALGGVLFALEAMGCDEDLVAAAGQVQTTAISGAFLLWAARGQALAPVHDLLAAAVADNVPAARSAARALGNVGHSSGADFAQGLCWGLTKA